MSLRSCFSLEVDQIISISGAPCCFCRRGCYFGCLKGVSTSVLVLSNSIEAVMVLTLIILKQRALLLRESEVVYGGDRFQGSFIEAAPVPRVSTFEISRPTVCGKVLRFKDRSRFWAAD